MRLSFSGQDMGQDVESYFQEVLASVEKSAEESGRRESGALKSRLQHLYNEILGDIDSGSSEKTVN